MLTPPRMVRPRVREAPERMLPVQRAWPPSPSLLNRPLMTLILSRNGASGARLGPSSISAPLPLAHQCGGEMPSPMNMQANRCGVLACGRRSAAPDRHRFQPRQCHGDAQALQKQTAGEIAGDHRSPLCASGWNRDGVKFLQR